MAAPGTLTHVLEVAAALKAAADTHAATLVTVAAEAPAPEPPPAVTAPAPLG